MDPLTQGDESTQEWVKKFIPKHLDNHPCKNLPLSAENFEEWGYSPDSNIDEEVYLTAFLATWLSGQAKSDFSAFIHPKPFG